MRLFSFVVPDWRHRHLIAQLLRRRIEARFRGSMLGVGWNLLMPLMMLLVYTLVFDHFLKIRWPGAEAGGGLAAALRIYLGLIVLNYVAENLGSAPTLLLEHVQFVKKVVFPLPTLAYVAATSALVPLVFGIVVAAVMAVWLPDTRPWRLAALLFYWLPLYLYALAIHWWFGALGVYVRDLAHLTAPLSTMLMFLSPVFYSAEILPPPWNTWIVYNPLTVPIETARTLLFEPSWPAPGPTLISLAVALMLAFSGRIVFRKLQRGFADVL